MPIDPLFAYSSGRDRLANETTTLHIVDCILLPIGPMILTGSGSAKNIPTSMGTVVSLVITVNDLIVNTFEPFNSSTLIL